MPSFICGTISRHHPYQVQIHREILKEIEKVWKGSAPMLAISGKVGEIWPKRCPTRPRDMQNYYVHVQDH